MKAWLRTHWQYLANIILFLIFLDIAIHQIVLKVVPLDGPLHEWYWTSAGRHCEALSAWLSGNGIPSGGAADSSFLWYSIYGNGQWLDSADWSKMTLADWAFAAQTMLMISLVLLRRRHAAISKNPSHQLIALVAFCSGVLFIGAETAPAGIMLTISTAIILLASLLAVASLLNLGRSFGILIALRKVKTGGVYGVVRHPMYASDILLRVGYVVSHLSMFTLGLLAVSTGAYMYRALLEERFLERDPEYRQYEERVPYRFIPGIW